MRLARSTSFAPGRTWVHSPMHSGVGVRHRSDLLLTARPVAAERSRLGEACEANDQEERRRIQEKMEAEELWQARVKRMRKSCAPCLGIWPARDCKAERADGGVGVPAQRRGGRGHQGRPACQDG